jgi:hypothetical protein
VIEVYRKPDPDCLRCLGRGFIIMRTLGETSPGIIGTTETRSERCVCTDYLSTKERDGKKESD